MKHYYQQNVSLTPDQVEFVKANKDKMNVGELAKMLGLTYGKVHNNLKVLGLVKRRKAVVVKMDGYFDVEEFQYRYYNF